MAGPGQGLGHEPWASDGKAFLHEKAESLLEKQNQIELFDENLIKR